MKRISHSLAIGLVVLLLSNALPSTRACGPEVTTPIFVFKESPDVPFTDFVKGNIGIVRPSFGRKTLVIAYRYLNGGGFNSAEQAALIEALEGKPPDDLDDDGVKAW